MSETVTVACKLPNGIMLRVFAMTETSELVLGGGSRKVKKAVQMNHEPIKIEGSAAPFGTPKMLFGGYAMTRGVPKDLFDEWMKQNADSDIVRKNLIFAATDDRYTQDQALEQSEIKSGLEPLVPDNDVRTPSKVKTEAA